MLLRWCFRLLRPHTIQHQVHRSAACHCLAMSTTAPALSAADRKTIEVCFGLLLKQIEKLDSESAQPLESTIKVDSARMAEYADVLSHALTKFVVFVSQGEVPILVSSVEELTNHITGISCLLRSLLSPSSSMTGITAGPTQRAQIIQVHKSVLAGLTQVLSQLQHHLLAKSSTKLDASLTGRAWEIMEKQLKTVPLTNATAIGRAVNQACTVLKDARAELDRMHVASAEELASKEDKDNDDEDDDDFDEDGEDALTEAEFAIVPAVKSISSTAGTLVKSLYMYLLKVKIDESKSESIDWLEFVLKSVQTIGNRNDDLIESLYSPQDRKAVLKAVEALATELRANALSIVKHSADAKADWPVKASAVATAADSASGSAGGGALAAATFSSEATYASTFSTAASLVQSGDEVNHAHRMEWLRRCLEQVFESERMAKDC